MNILAAAAVGYIRIGTCYFVAVGKAGGRAKLALLYYTLYPGRHAYSVGGSDSIVSLTVFMFH